MRLAQLDTAPLEPEYFLTDALGSIRQLTDSNGNLTLSKAYDPYGTVAQSAGAGQSSYGYTSEYQDGYNDLVYLRARHYAPGMGRFLSRDTWAGEYNRPGSLNRWGYVEGNPVNATDPSGYITEKQGERADVIRANLYRNYQLVIKKDWGLLSDLWRENGHANVTPTKDCWQQGNWELLELETILASVKDLSRGMNGADNFKKFVGQVTVIKSDRACGRGCLRGRTLEIKSGGNPPSSVDIMNSSSVDKWTVVHELGHAWDSNFGWKLSKSLEKETQGHTSWLEGLLATCDVNSRLPGCNRSGYFYGGIPPAGSDGNFNRVEDFAESVTAYIYPITAQSKVAIYANDPNYAFLYYADYTKTSRWDFINSLINGTITP